MTTQQFPAGSYIIRMDQPYSRIADALLDHQYWSPNDPQKNPYDDTGWTFPAGFGVQSVRVSDTTVLHVPMSRVTGPIVPPGGVTGTGSVYAIDNHGDNALATLRYALPRADFQAVEQPFTAAGQSFARGAFVIRNVPRAELDRTTTELGLRATALASAPSVAMHPLRAARVAILHTWTSTQTEGWWRMAFDFNRIPYDYISTQDVAAASDLNAKYDVIVFPPSSSGQQIIEGMPMWRNPLPWKKTALTPNLGRIDETDDMRPGLGYDGLETLKRFVARGGVLVTSTSTSEFAVDFGLAAGVSVNSPARGKVVGSLLSSRVVDDASPIVYGVMDSMAVYSDDGTSFSVSSTRGGRGFRGGAGAGGDRRATGRGTTAPGDGDVVPGRPTLDPRFEAPARPSVKPWQASPVTDDMLRNPINVIPPDQRPRVALRFGPQRGLLVSGLLDGGGDIAERPLVVDVPLQQGHVVLFANNPMWRGETIGSYTMVFNTILNFDNLNAGRTLDAK